MHRLRTALALFPDGGGVLRGHDLKNAVTVVTGSRPTREELLTLGFSSLESTRDHFHLTMSEYLGLIDQRDHLRMLFRLFDGSGKGFITCHDLLLVCEEGSPSLSKPAVEAAFAEADTLGTGRISFLQFEQLMNSSNI